MIGLKGIVVGEGDSYEEALAIETFGPKALEVDSPKEA